MCKVQIKKFFEKVLGLTKRSPINNTHQKHPVHLLKEIEYIHDWKIPKKIWKQFYNEEDFIILEKDFPKNCVLANSVYPSYKKNKILEKGYCTTKTWYWFAPDFYMEDHMGLFTLGCEDEPNTGILWPNWQGDNVWAPNFKYALKVLFEEEICKMPLCINDPYPVMAHVAKWRLKIGK